ncbi:MAG: low affinity iron permease family protein [Xanthobacteraceae bacterium]
MTKAARREEGRSAGKLFGAAANYVARQAGRPVAFALAALAVIVWLVSGPYFGYSDTWQLVINTGTTIITFLMVFLIQNSQNRDSAAIQVKLDELIRVSKVKNFYIGIEHLTDEELDEIRAKCESRAAASRAVGRRANGSTGGKAGKVADRA